MIRRSAVTHPPGNPTVPAHPSQHGGEGPGRGEPGSLWPRCLSRGGRLRVSADTPDQVELFQGVARWMSDMLQRPVFSYANSREIVITLRSARGRGTGFTFARLGFPARADSPGDWAGG
jgi:hypothetical protein